MKEQVKAEFNKYKKLIDEYLNKSVEILYPEKIYEAMRYSLLAEGKRLRPVMAIAAAKLFGVDEKEVLPAACAIEMLHCQSLIHDDLPSMDNDDYRRGRPSNHKVYGEAAAILAGDALLSFAPKLIIEKTPKSVRAETVLKILREFFIAAGVDGIISGQIVDLDSEKKEINEETLNFLYEYKTAKLFKLAVRAGALLGNADIKQLEYLTLYACYYGHAFQIYDDILDSTSTLEELGKTPGKDARAKKSTYVSKYGLSDAKNKTIFLCGQAYDILEKGGINSLILEGTVTDIIEGIAKCS